MIKVKSINLGIKKRFVDDLGVKRGKKIGEKRRKQWRKRKENERKGRKLEF